MLGDILKNTAIPGFKYSFNTKLGTIISDLFLIVFYLSAFIAFFWFVWGAFQYILAGGDKEHIANARKRMTWAIVGLIFILLSFTIAKFVFEILEPNIISLPFEK